MESMKELLAKTKFSLPKPGSLLDGEVLSVSKSNVIIDLGPLGSGVVYPKDFYDDPDAQKNLKPNQIVKVILLEFENEEGYHEVSLKKAQLQNAWQEIRKIFEENRIITVKIINLNKGGLITEINGIKAFLPLSQLSEKHYPKVENGSVQEIIKILQGYRNQDFQVKIIDLNEGENKLIISEKAAYEAILRESVLKYKVNDIVKGVISEITDFGVFVKIIDGFEALIPKNEIDWIDVDPKSVFQVGQVIEAKIIKVDQNKIILSLRALKNNPWLSIKDKYHIGQKVKGRVVNSDNNGVYVEIEKDIIGFVPLVEFGNKNIEEIIKIGEEYGFAIIEFEPEKQKLLLIPEKVS